MIDLMENDPYFKEFDFSLEKYRNIQDTWVNFDPSLKYGVHGTLPKIAKSVRSALKKSTPMFVTDTFKMTNELELLEVREYLRLNGGFELRPVSGRL